MRNRFILFIAIMIALPLRAYPFCFEEASKQYGVNPKILQAISKVESNHKNAAIHTNKNGSQDRGHMQINSYWKGRLGAGWPYILKDACYTTKIGAWILKQCMDRYGNTWDAIACYNTGKAPNELTQSKRMLALEYIQKVQRQIQPKGAILKNQPAIACEKNTFAIAKAPTPRFETIGGF